LIESEDKSNPLDDDALMQALLEKDFRLARRTVAKYREQMGIPVARLRKLY
jgi:RNA polymerase sigma-54 factor